MSSVGYSQFILQKMNLDKLIILISKDFEFTLTSNKNINLNIAIKNDDVDIGDIA